MALTFEKLKALFSLKKGTLETANRSTLNRFVAETELQRRRQALYQASCAPNKHKSRVSLCKRAKRPSFAIQLDTLSTKELRATIQEFLNDIGLQQGEGKSEAQLKKLAAKFKWNSVLYLSEELDKEDEKQEDEKQPEKSHKKAGGGGDDTLKQWDKSEKSRAIKIEEIDSQAPQVARRQRGESVPRSTAKRPRAISKRYARTIVPSHQGPRIASLKLNRMGQYINPPSQNFPITGLDTSQIPEMVGPLKVKKNTIEPLVRKSEQRTEKTKSLPKILGGKTETKITQNNDQESSDSEGEMPKNEEDVEPKQTKKCRIEPPLEDSCEACEPIPLHDIQLNVEETKEYERLNAKRKMTCAKLALLKCTLDLQNYQRLVWNASELNTCGDYFSRATANDKRFKNPQFTNPEIRDDLKSVLANQNASHRFKIGQDHVSRRLRKDRKKLTSGYTLASMRYDQLVDENAWSNDKYTTKALQNRPQIDKPIPGQVSCETEVEKSSDCKCHSPKRAMASNKDISRSPPLEEDGPQTEKAQALDVKRPDPIPEPIPDVVIPPPVQPAEPIEPSTIPRAKTPEPIEPPAGVSRPPARIPEEAPLRPPVGMSRSPVRIPEEPEEAPAKVAQSEKVKDALIKSLKPIHLGLMKKGDAKSRKTLIKLFHYDITPHNQEMVDKWDEYPSEISESDEEGFQEWLDFQEEPPEVAKPASGFGDVGISEPPTPIITQGVSKEDQGNRPDKIIESFNDNPKGVGMSQRNLGVSVAKQLYAKRYQEYSNEFLRPLDIYISQIDYLYIKIEHDERISAKGATNRNIEKSFD